MQKKLTYTILSISLLTVMAGAAVAPALGIIRQHFSDEPEILIKFIVSMPALFIILVNLLFQQVCRFLRTRTIALLGLTMYVVFGTGVFLVNDITALLVMRALLGVSVGLIMPLSTGLLAYYYPPHEMARLMGLSAAMNQMGGVVATLLAGILASVQWNYAFLVYLMGLPAIVLVILFLPNDKLSPAKGLKRESERLRPQPSADEVRELARHEGLWVLLRRFHPSVVGMLLCMSCFFVFVTNFAITEGRDYDTLTITWLMVGTDVMGFIIGLLFGRMMKAMRRQMKYVPALCFLVAYICFAGHLLTILACICVGIANGVGIPYLNTIASIKGGKESVTTVMPLISASLYIGQFVTPMVVGACSELLFAADLRGPYKVGIILALCYLVQVFCTRHFQSLPRK